MAFVRCFRCHRITAEENAVLVAGVLYGPECAAKARSSAVISDEDWFRILSEDNDDEESP